MAREIEARMQEVEGRIEALEQELQALRREAYGGPVADYALSGAEGRVTLSQLFGDRDRLIVIHNMGFACPYCTMWADGFNGLLPHIEERAAFVLTSPDSVEQQQQGAARRGWKIRMVSTQASTFAIDMGFEQDGSPTPGVSTFVRAPDGSIRRHAATSLGPGDKFCSVWSFVELLPEQPEAAQ